MFVFFWIIRNYYAYARMHSCLYTYVNRIYKLSLNQRLYCGSDINIHKNDSDVAKECAVNRCHFSFSMFSAYLIVYSYNRHKHLEIMILIYMVGPKQVFQNKCIICIYISHSICIALFLTNKPIGKINKLLLRQHCVTHIIIITSNLLNVAIC